MIEPLEPRQLLAGVTLKHGILTINGTDGPDDVAITQQRVTQVTPRGQILFVTQLDVRVNGDFQGDFNRTDFTKVVVNLKGGNDLFAVGRKDIPFEINGGDGDDTLSGGLASDTIRGGAGVNQMFGLKGNDHLICTSGGDILSGGLGHDTADFSPFTSSLNITLDDLANDSEEGRTGNVHSDIETVIGGGGPDFISAADQPASTSVVLFGGGGNDTLIGGASPDTIKGGPGNDSIRGGDGPDYINGDGGRDKIFGEGGTDTLNGGGPDPKFIPIPIFQPTVDQDTTGGGSDGAVDTLDGGPGNDVVIVDPFDITRHI